MPIDPANPKDVAYWQLGDFIYDQNPYGGFDAQIAKAGSMRVVADLEAAGGDIEGPVNRSKPREAPAHLTSRNRSPIPVVAKEADANTDTVEATGIGRGFNAEHPYTHNDVTKAPPSAFGQGEDPYSLLLKEGIFWYFDGTPNRVSKAMRIKYTVVNREGHAEDRYLLVGYVGGGGM